MLTSIRLTALDRSWLRRLAKKLGVSQSEVLRRGLDLLVARERGSPPARPYDAWKLFVGCFGSRDGTLSHGTGEDFRQLLVEKKRQGRL